MNNTKQIKRQINHGDFGGRRHISRSGSTKAFRSVEEVSGGFGSGRSDENINVMVKVMWVLLVVGMRDLHKGGKRDIHGGWGAEPEICRRETVAARVSYQRGESFFLQKYWIRNYTITHSRKDISFGDQSLQLRAEDIHFTPTTETNN